MSLTPMKQARFGKTCHDLAATNSTLKLKLVTLLLGMHFATPTLAIGLGDLTVRSSLGQPLDATVEVLSAPPALEADCLSLRSSDNGLPAPAQARLKVERRGDKALLHITTARPVDDPVAQFVLTSECEGRLQREYVLLLDPPEQIVAAGLPPPNTGLEPVAAGMPTTATSTSFESAATSAMPRPRASRTKPRRYTAPKSVAPKAAAVLTTPPATATPHASLTQPGQVAPSRPKAETAMPRLVISGKRHVSQSDRLPAGGDEDRALPDQSSSRSTSLTSTELSDENTALNHRLAHLESQIAALHRRNAELEAQLAYAPLSTTITQPAATQVSPWPLYLISAGLFSLSGVMVAGMRRRRDLPSGMTSTFLPWARPIDAMRVGADVDPMPPLSPPDATFQNDSSPQGHATTGDQDFAQLPLTALAEKTEIKEDILNQAEVYIAHGYPNLAISLLQEYLNEEPAGSPVPWLLLLDLLLRQGDESAYAKASTECRRHFNVNFSTPPGAQDQVAKHGLENYPHTLDMLTRAWNKPEINAIFSDLIYDQRDGVRMGFAPDAYRDILLLRSIV